MYKSREPSFFLCHRPAHASTVQHEVVPERKVEFFSVPEMPQPVLIPPVDPMLRPDTIPSMPLRSEEVDLVLRASEKNERWPGADWLRSMTELFSDV